MLILLPTRGSAFQGISSSFSGELLKRSFASREYSERPFIGGRAVGGARSASVARLARGISEFKTQSIGSKINQ